MLAKQLFLINNYWKAVGELFSASLSWNFQWIMESTLHASSNVVEQRVEKIVYSKANEI